MKFYTKLALLTCILATSQSLLADNTKMAVPLKALGAPATDKTVHGPSTNINRAILRNDVVTTKLGANLTARIQWGDEICVQSCPKIARDLKIAYATCEIDVRVRNTGDTDATGSFRIRLDWTDHDGSVDSRVKIVNGVGINQTKNVRITAEDIGYYRLGRPFKVTVDDQNQVPETNENDNVATLTTF